MDERIRKYVSKEHDEVNNSSDEPVSRESTRPRAGRRLRLRHHRDCACGRPRALLREGHRWRRLGACRRCLRAASPQGRGLPETEEVGRG